MLDLTIQRRLYLFNLLKSKSLQRTFNTQYLYFPFWVKQSFVKASGEFPFEIIRTALTFKNLEVNFKYLINKIM